MRSTERYKAGITALCSGGVLAAAAASYCAELWDGGVAEGYCLPSRVALWAGSRCVLKVIVLFF
jgi:Cys-tRNA synthase (O-phospho-L-seryl-tRNA:Cys-tRNA synthase)